MPSKQDCARQVPPRHNARLQSPFLAHLSPWAQGPQHPPQSTSDSPGSRSPFAQARARHSSPSALAPLLALAPAALALAPPTVSGALPPAAPPAAARPPEATALPAPALNGLPQATANRKMPALTQAKTKRDVTAFIVPHGTRRGGDIESRRKRRLNLECLVSVPPCALPLYRVVGKTFLRAVSPQLVGGSQLRPSPARRGCERARSAVGAYAAAALTPSPIGPTSCSCSMQRSFRAQSAVLAGVSEARRSCAVSS
jgi:hypothetical protein